MKNKKLWVLVSLLIILAITCFFRLWKLNEIPPGLYPDVAMNGIDALNTIETGNYKLFYPDNNGREGLFMWLIAFSFHIFGPSVWAIKIVAAIFGILTVLGLYLLVKELLKTLNSKSCILYSEIVALLSAFFLATSFWHVNFSRLGFRAILVPFSLVFGFYFLIKGFNNKKLFSFIVAGIFFGTGFYTYISYRFVVFILAVFLLCQWLTYRKESRQKQFWLFTICFSLFVFVVALPIGIYFLGNLGDFFGRAGGVSIFSSKNPIYELGKSIILHLGMFNIYGDQNWRHNYAGSPMLSWIVGIFFLVGVILLIKKLVFYLKNKDWQRFSAILLLFVWFFFMMAPGFLSSEGAPHALRVIGAMPVVFIFSGIGVFWIFSKIKNIFKTKLQKISAVICVILFFSAITFAEFEKYFYSWGKNIAVSDAFSENFVQVGNYLNSLPEDIQKYVIVNQGGVPVPYPDGLPVASQTPMFLERTKYGRVRSTYVLPENLNKIKIDKSAIIMALQKDDNLFAELLQRFPYGKIEKNNNLWVFKIN